MVEQKKKPTKEALINQKKMTTLSGEEARKFKQLTEEIKREKTRSSAELEQSTTRQQKKIQQRLDDLEALHKQLEIFHSMGDKDGAQHMLDLVRIENELKLLKAKAEIDRDIISEKGKAKVKVIRKTGKISAFRQAGNLIVSFFKGLTDTSNEDISSIERATKLIQGQLKKAKTEKVKNIWAAASYNLEVLLQNHRYTDEQIKNIADKIIEQAKSQIDKEK